ncbi:DASH complex subunit Dad2-domain-containing protein [Kalaharituber pfeilii]|nr:DASH complex subunit Dad2-domain-containing protein [Kalaharituber pfeilii]
MSYHQQQPQQQVPRYSTAPRQSSLGAGTSAGLYSSQQSASPALLQRINEKREELDNLLQLKELSALLALQMEQLEAKLNTLADGTEAIAHVLANWQNVLRAISMASTPLSKLSGKKVAEKDPFISDPDSGPEKKDQELPMPITLVRIPTQDYQNLNNAR